MQHTKRIVSFLTAVFLFVSLLSVGFRSPAAASAADVPTVYVVAGMWGQFNSNGELVTDFSMPEGFLEAAVKERIRRKAGVESGAAVRSGTV